MKRSEALQLMCDFYDKHCYDYRTHHEFFDKLLTVLQEAGLKPPLTKKCPVLLRTEHVWENENE